MIKETPSEIRKQTVRVELEDGLTEEERDNFMLVPPRKVISFKTKNKLKAIYNEKMHSGTFKTLKQREMSIVDNDFEQMPSRPGTSLKAEPILFFINDTNKLKESKIVFERFY